MLSAGSAGIWTGKALRASAGSAFRMPSVRMRDAGEVREALRGFRVLASVGSADAQTIDAEDLTAATALLIGNEGAGLGPEWLAIADQRVTIPCSGPVESLNAAMAGAVMLYEAQRQRTAQPSAHAEVRTQRNGRAGRSRLARLR